MKTAIIYLTHNEPSHLDNLRQSLRSVRNYWTGTRQPSPAIIVFHEGLSEESLDELRDIGLVDQLVLVKFEIPPWVDKDRVPPYHFGTIGYRHMCRFFAGEFLRHPVLQEFDYVWRLDTDSFLTRPLPYNPFEKLAEQKAVYGYLTSFCDIPEVTTNLLETTNDFIQQKLGKLRPFNWERRLYYTNFEILDVDWFRRSGYLDYFDYLDQAGGIYYWRWGDHVIRYLGLEIFGSQTHLFENIGYRHQGFVC